MNTKPSFVSVIHALFTLSDEEMAAVVERPELLKQFASKLLADNVANTYVIALSDDEAIKLLVQTKKYESEERVREIVANWRKYASNIGYTGPVAWRRSRRATR